MEKLETAFALALRRWLSEQKLDDAAGQRIFNRIIKRMREPGKDKDHAETDE